MKATGVLMSEHRVIEQVLSCLEALASHAEESGAFDAESAGQALDFFRAFAARCHHAKEEVHLSPLLESRGLPREGEPTGVMLAEHELGRKLLAEMAAAAARGTAGGATPRPSPNSRRLRASLVNVVVCDADPKWR